MRRTRLVRAPFVSKGAFDQHVHPMDDKALLRMRDSEDALDAVDALPTALEQPSCEVCDRRTSEAS